MLINPTVDMLRRMRLPAMAQAYIDQRDKPQAVDGLSFDERFALVVDREYLARKDHRIARYLKDAKLRIPAAPEDIDYRTPRGLDRSITAGLLDGQWIQGRQNVLLTGLSGVGKTYLACALGTAACQLGFTTLYYRMPRLLSDLAVSLGDGSYARRLQKLASADLLILDDWGLEQLSPSL